MNRLILVGNGFDIYVGLNTDYPHLLSKVLHYIISELNPLGENILIKVNENVKVNIDEAYKNGINDFFNELLNLKNNNKIEIKSKFLNELLKSFKKRERWCDYETIMYKCSVEISFNPYELECVIFLNNCIINEIKSENNRKSKIKDYDEKINKLAKKLNSDKREYRRTLICNFNYTDTFEDVAKQIKHEGDILYIHGNLKNEKTCKFGYYLEDKDRASWRGIPENSWINKDCLSIERNTLKNFALFDEFELFTIGLSYGESDKKLLQQDIFDSKNCYLVRPMVYFKDDKGSDSYEDTVNTITNNFNFNSFIARRLDCRSFPHKIKNKLI